MRDNRIVGRGKTYIASGGAVDANAQHESEEAVERKYVIQQFIWSARPEEDDVDEAVRLYWRSFAEDQPERPLSEVFI